MDDSQCWIKDNATGKICAQPGHDALGLALVAFWMKKHKTFNLKWCQHCKEQAQTERYDTLTGRWCGLWRWGGSSGGVFEENTLAIEERVCRACTSPRRPNWIKLCANIVFTETLLVPLGYTNFGSDLYTCQTNWVGIWLLYCNQERKGPRIPIFFISQAS